MGVVRNFNFGLQVNGIKYQPAHDKSSLKGRGQDHAHIKNFTLPEIFLERLKVETSNFVY